MTDLPEEPQKLVIHVDEDEKITDSPFPTIPSEYYRRIIELFKELEKTHGIKILYALKMGQGCKVFGTKDLIVILDSSTSIPIKLSILVLVEK